jgi:meiotic recombination protein SPO11
MSTYKYGSVALAHQSQSLAVPSIRWLGVRSNDIVQDLVDRIGLLRLSTRDRRIARLMLAKYVFGEEETEQEWKRELQVMLILNVKAETQILNSGMGLDRWLDGKLSHAMSD